MNPLFEEGASVTLWVCPTGTCDRISLKIGNCKCSEMRPSGVLRWGTLIEREYVAVDALLTRDALDAACCVESEIRDRPWMDDTGTPLDIPSWEERWRESMQAAIDAAKGVPT